MRDDGMMRGMTGDDEEDDEDDRLDSASVNPAAETDTYPSATRRSFTESKPSTTLRLDA